MDAQPHKKVYAYCTNAISFGKRFLNGRKWRGIYKIPGNNEKRMLKRLCVLYKLIKQSLIRLQTPKRFHIHLTLVSSARSLSFSSSHSSSTFFYIEYYNSQPIYSFFQLPLYRFLSVFSLRIVTFVFPFLFSPNIKCITSHVPTTLSHNVTMVNFHGIVVVTDTVHVHGALMIHINNNY